MNTPPTPAFSNSAEGTHSGHITLRLSAPVAARHRLAKPGPQPGTVTLCGANDMPLGVFTDQGDTGDPINVALLGSTPGTLLMCASGNINAGDPIYTAPEGKVCALPSTPGTYYRVGRALNSATDNTLLEADPYNPTPVLITE